MDVERFYELINGNYQEVLSRLMNDNLIEKFLKKFKENQSLDELRKAVELSDLEKAFIEVHTLKGVSLNLSFTGLSEACSKLTEMLRGDNKLKADINEVKKAFDIIEKEYFLVISNIE